MKIIVRDLKFTSSDYVGRRCKFFCLFGTNWDNGTHAGTFYLNLNNVTSNSWSNIGTHLLLKTLKLIVKHLILTSW